MPPLPPLQHVVLSAYFPNTLTSLHDYLVCRLDDSSRIVDSTADCPAYKGFLHTTLVGEMSPTGESRAAKGAFPRGSAGEVGRKQNEVVNGVIETLFRISEKENGKPSHMLTRGYKKLRLQTMTKGGGHGGLAGASGIKGVENPFPNSLVTQVKSQCWASLLERIGDAAMVYILMHTFIFLALPNGSYCQLTGIQLSELPLPPATQNSTVRIRTGRFKQPILSELTAPRRKGKSKTINASPPEPGKYETDKMSPGDTKSTVEAPKKQKKEEQTVPSSSAETNLGDAMQVGEASRKFKQDEHMTLLSAEINLGHAMQVDEASRKYKQEEHMTLLSSVETNMQVDEVLRKHKQEEKECMTMLSSVETSPGNVMQIEEVSRKHKREEEEQTKSLSSAEALNWIDRPPKKRRAKTAVGWGVKPTNANGKAGTPKSPGPPSKVPFEKLKSRKRKKRKEKQTAPAAGAAGSSEERRGGDEETTQSETSDIAAPSEVAASTDVLMLTGERPKKKVKLVTANEILPSLETSWSVGNSDRGVESESSSGGSQRQKSESDTAIEEAVKSDRALGARNAKKKKANVRANTTEKGKPPSTIQIFRLRMFYARPNYNMAGEILFGLPKIHVLNRYRGTSPTPRSPQPPSVTPSPDIDPIILSAAGSAASGDTNRDATAEHILKYIFPRHFGLENMFVGAAALSPEASSRFVRPKEFLLRTQEIQASKNPIKIHWRMRAIKPLVQRMQMLHSRCQYKNLLMFYCPVKGCNNTVENNWRITRSDTEVDGMQQADASWNGDQNRTNSNDAEILMEVENIANKQHVETDGRVPEADQGNALEPLDDEISPNPIALFSSYHQVSSFVQAILKLVIPRDFWGSDSNRKLTFNAVDRFVRMRKFETISLHEILQGFKTFLGAACFCIQKRSMSRLITRDIVELVSLSCRYSISDVIFASIYSSQLWLYRLSVALALFCIASF
ncbi:hypothetical protein BC936DRAFT_146596 [Jimgerdemannia flammicorona]|uniref:Telomerase reverse transcriptase n=1 Tax=Jimgerdemannia flammicorona TaxID=994334 RepID=A0A433D770_9FUNG|nr:hypothetical protein BC936DRAFT_146596 [Jimgerdemannia flammicorona]